MTPQTPELDDLDWAILAALQEDGRASFNQLSRQIHLSAPAVAERVRRLERQGVITSYSAQVDRAAVGQALTCFVELRCSPARCLLKTTRADELPEVSEIHKLSGERCTMLKIHATSLAHLEGLIERISEHGELRTHIVLSTQFEGRPVEPIEPDRPVTDSGWMVDRTQRR